MSDFIVYKKLPCKHTSEDTLGDPPSLTCVRQEYDLVEVDLEEAIIEILCSNGEPRLANIIRQTAEPIRFA